MVTVSESQCNMLAVWVPVREVWVTVGHRLARAFEMEVDSAMEVRVPTWTE